jgi:hypothetical protein
VNLRTEGEAILEVLARVETKLDRLERGIALSGGPALGYARPMAAEPPPCGKDPCSCGLGCGEESDPDHDAAVTYAKVKRAYALPPCGLSPCICGLSCNSVWQT